jgi:hypothetical protein
MNRITPLSDSILKSRVASYKLPAKYESWITLDLPNQYDETYGFSRWDFNSQTGYWYDGAYYLGDGQSTGPNCSFDLRAGHGYNLEFKNGAPVYDPDFYYPEFIA